mgnify:FL=1
MRERSRPRLGILPRRHVRGALHAHDDLDFSIFISSFVNIQVAPITYDMAAATLTLSAQHACVHS